MDRVLFSSARDDWSTPQPLFDELDLEFRFYMDVCASHENTKCSVYYDRKDDGLMQPWFKTVWCNPPYGKNIGLWVKKAYETSLQGHTVVMLLPVRTDTRWFHDYILGRAEIRFIRGRLHFGGCANPAPFPSMIVVFRPFSDLNPVVKGVGVNG